MNSSKNKVGIAVNCQKSKGLKQRYALAAMRLPMAVGLMMGSTVASAITFRVGDGEPIKLQEGNSAPVKISVQVGSFDNIPKGTSCLATGKLLGVPENSGATDGVDYTFASGFSINFVSPGPDIDGVPSSQDILINAVADGVAEQPESFKVAINRDSVSVTCGETAQRSLAIPDAYYGPVVTIQDRVFVYEPIKEPAFDPAQAAKALLPQMESLTVLTLSGAQARNTLLARELSSARDEKLSRNRVSMKLDGAAIPVVGGAAGDEVDSPWGTFVSGDLELGDRTLDQNNGFDYTTNTLIAGVDYKMGEHWVLGGGISRTSADAEIKHKLDDTQLDQNALSLFTSFYGKHYYIDAVFTQGDNQYDLLRTANDDKATATTDGSETSYGLGAGYTIDFTASTLKLFSRLDYVDSSVSSYTEKTTGNLASANIYDFNVTSFTGNLGVGWNWVINTSYAVFTPEVGLDVEHQFEGDGVIVAGRFVGNQTGAFEIATTKRDTDYLNGNLSLNAVFPRGISGFVSYTGQVGRDNWASDHFALGARVEL